MSLPSAGGHGARGGFRVLQWSMLLRLAHILAGCLGVALYFAVLWDGFETIVLPRRVTRRWRLARAFYISTWEPSRAVLRRIQNPRRREAWLGIFGPLSLLLLLIFWAGALMAAFVLMRWALVGGGWGGLWFASGSDFFTLGLIQPASGWGRLLTILEAGTGFGFLALVIGYLPVIYQAFSRREGNISLLDARAGSPPSAGELLRRGARDVNELTQLLKDFEVWTADLMESHISYPVLGYFRSLHDNQSWLATLVTMLDACTLVIAGAGCSEPAPLALNHSMPEAAVTRQARLSFALARHALVDLAQVMHIQPAPFDSTLRLPAPELARLRKFLFQADIPWVGADTCYDALADLRRMYEPYASALSTRLLMPLPEWLPGEKTRENWLSSAWNDAGQLRSRRALHEDWHH